MKWPHPIRRWRFVRWHTNMVLNDHASCPWCSRPPDLHVRDEKLKGRARD